MRCISFREGNTRIICRTLMLRLAMSHKKCANRPLQRPRSDWNSAPGTTWTTKTFEAAFLTREKHRLPQNTLPSAMNFHLSMPMTHEDWWCSYTLEGPIDNACFRRRLRKNIILVLMSEYFRQELDFITRTIRRLTNNVRIVDFEGFSVKKLSDEHNRREEEIVARMDNCYP